MSAPAPAPPPHRVPLTPSSASPSARSSESPRRDVAGHGSGSGPRALPHIQDLVQIVERRVDGIRYASLDKMLATAGTALKQSRFFVDLGRIDNAYVEYLFGSQIVTDVLRTSKDAPALHDSSQRHKQHKDLIRLINADQQTFIGVRDTIKADNERNGTRPAAASASAVTQATATVQDRPIPQGPRPQVEHARPQSFQPHTSPNSSANDALAQRFAQLRTSGRPVDGRPQSVMSDYAVRRGAPSLHMDSASAQNGIEQSGMAPGESPTQEFPKAPSPTYTPIRSLQSPTAIAPPRSTRTSANPLDRRTSTSSNASSASLARGSLISRHSTKRSEDFDSGNAAQKRPRRKSINKPMETEIDAQKLFDYLQTYSILLIDVRGRDQYDEGHIFASTGICIEPTSLRLNMSAEELYEALVLSPQEEQEFFEHRDMFDLVVYYDQSSTTASRNAGRSKALVALQEALYEYNQDKPLRFPPIMLDGGLDSWVEMVGIHSLMVSNTANRPRSIQRKPELRAHASSRIETQKRRHREYNPLAPEEEAKWRERARSESIVLDQQPPRPQQQIPPETNDGGSSYDISDFSRRYPDVSLVEKTQYEAPPREQQHVPAYPVPPRPSSQPPAPPVPPHPQSAPPLPPVPSRPPPAIARPSYSGVSERSSSQPAAPQRPQKLATYIPPKLKRVPRVGLHNFGATCYMNSTIQCLSATIDLTAVFLDGAYKRDVQEKNWKGSKGLMPELYCVLLRNLWESSDVDTIRPTNFRKFCARLNKEWGTDTQQDAKEFLDFLMDILHEDLNVNWMRNPLRALTLEEEAQRERMPPFLASRMEWGRYIHRDYSRLTELFAGQHISRLQCTTCRHTSTTYEAFYSISVAIPQLSRPVTIYDCLKAYCQAEKLSGDEVWRCPQCKCEREAIKRITITRAPSFLIVHLKRFSASHMEKARKIHTAVDFPVRGLDLEPFMLPTPSPQDQEMMVRSNNNRKLEPTACMTPPYRYDAYGVIRHLGATMTSGHYIGLVQDRARGCWREFNDDRVTDFRPEELPPGKRLQNEQAYVVFYQRV